MPTQSYPNTKRTSRKRIKQVSRGRRLTGAEARKYRAIRKKVDQEMPQTLAEHHARQTLNCLLEELRGARESQGLSLADVRKRTGMDRSALSKLENGQRENPTLETLVRYAEAVGKRLVIRLESID